VLVTLDGSICLGTTASVDYTEIELAYTACLQSMERTDDTSIPKPTLMQGNRL